MTDLSSHCASSSRDVSLVIPVYRSAGSLAELLERIDRVMAESGKSFEIVCVDDASPDGTWTMLKSLRDRHSGLRLARLSRNMGQHSALLCGCEMARGEVVVTLDDDLQHPPEEIPKLIAGIEQGHDLVIGAYETKEHARLRNWGGRLVDGLLRRMFGLDRSYQLTSFRAVRRGVIQEVVRMSGVYPYLTAMLLMHSDRRANVTVRHDPRRVGASRYSLRRSLALAANLIFSYSNLPLYFVALTSLTAFVGSLTYGGVVLVRALVAGVSVPGWASTIVVLSILNALILLCLAVFGLYLSRMNDQLTHGRARYTVSETDE